MQTEVAPGTKIDWSTVTPEEIWTEVGKQYASNGPRFGLSLLDNAIDKDVISTVEGEQVRAGFLYELGRIDEAFLSLSLYKLDETHPDLLRLRGEILWEMGRYEEARRDYDKVISSQGSAVDAETLFAAVRLYDDMGLWDQADQIGNRLRTAYPGDPATLRLDLQNALQTDDVRRINAAEQSWNRGKSATPQSSDPVVAATDATVAWLNGNASDGAKIARDSISSGGFDINVAMTMLRLDVESSDFEAFQADIKMCFDKLGATAWTDAPPETWPQPTDHPQDVALLLDWAATFELGRGDRAKAALLIDRALSISPYDSAAKQQQALLQVANQDIPKAFQTLNEALNLAPPSDMRVRVRALQLAQLATDQTPVAWDKDKVVSELAGIVARGEREYPQSALFQSADAELKANAGDFQSAAQIAAEACTLPGAGRDMQLRRAYYLVRLGNSDEAWEIAQDNLTANAPYLIWADALLLESKARSDQALGEFAMKVRSLIDPGNTQAEFFEPPKPQQSQPE